MIEFTVIGSRGKITIKTEETEKVLGVLKNYSGVIMRYRDWVLFAGLNNIKYEVVDE